MLQFIVPVSLHPHIVLHSTNFVSFGTLESTARQWNVTLKKKKKVKSIWFKNQHECTGLVEIEMFGYFLVIPNLNKLRHQKPAQKFILSKFLFWSLRWFQRPEKASITMQGWNLSGWLLLSLHHHGYKHKNCFLNL